jgi:hypothetical protein
MKKSYRYSRKIRQFKYLAKTLNRLIENRQFQQLSMSKRQKMIAKLQELHDKVRPYLGAAQVRKTIASAAVFLGLAVGSVNAQFADPVMNPFGLMGIAGLQFPTLVDIDGDGDMDLMTTTYDNVTYEANIEFIENIGTPDAPAFSATPVVNPFGINLSVIDQESLFDFDLADMDNDGDLDLLVGSYGYYYDGKLHYFENTGTTEAANFTTPTLNPFGLTTTYQNALPTIIDIDDDGDFDVLVGEYYGKIKFFENTGTPEVPSFAAPVDNPFGIIPAANTYYNIFDLADLDGDGDAEILMNNISYSGIVLTYQENIGTASMPEFGFAGAENPLNFNPGTNLIFLPEMSDLDGDGDVDVLLNVSESYTYSSSWMYFENLDIMSATDDLEETVDIQLLPNPVSDLLTVNAEFDQSVEKLTIEIFDASGRQLLIETINNHSGELNFQTNTSAYVNGLYLLKIQADGQFSTLKFMKE